MQDQRTALLAEARAEARADTRANTAPAARRLVAELWAGVASAAVILPQSMAFGVAVLAAAGVGSAAGAVAGLTGAAALCLMTGLVCGTRGLISAPTGPVIVLLSGALAQMSAAGVAGAELVLGLSALLCLTGLLQAGIGLSGAGRLIKFIPLPVVAGFMTGSAVLMILSQAKALFDADAAGVLGAFVWLPAVTAAATYAIVDLSPRVLPAIPGTIAGLAGGTALFHVGRSLMPAPAPDAWLVGRLPALDPAGLEVTIGALAALPWAVIGVSALALAVLASLDTLLTAVIADVSTGQRHDARRELLGQGLGQALAGVAGGLGGAGTTGATVVCTSTGGRRWAAVVAAAVLVLLLLVGGPVGVILPVAVLAGIILHVAVHMLERDVFAWVRRRRTRMDAAVALLVTLVTVVYDLMAAVGVGVAIAVALYLRVQARAPVVHRRSTGAELRSHRRRGERQHEALQEHGGRIVIYELRGTLFFGTSDRLCDELAPDLDRQAWVILDLRRVSQVDLTAARILRQAAERVRAHGGRLIFCEVHKGAGLGHNVKKTFRKIGAGRGGAKVRTFNGLDEAVEYAEDALLRECGLEPRVASGEVDLGATDLCAGMAAEQTEVLREFFRCEHVARGTIVCEAGDRGDTLFVVARGEIDVRLPTSVHHHLRLARCGPGTFFGEVSFIDPGPRAAQVVARSDCELMRLDRRAFSELTARRPDVAIALLLALGKAQGKHLRWSAREIHRLAQW